MENKITYLEAFNTEFKSWAEKSRLGSQYYRLLLLMGNEDLEEQLEYLHTLSEGRDEYFKEVGKEEWLAIWHKSMRQTDYYQNLFLYREVDKLTDEQRLELEQLRKEREYLKRKVVVRPGETAEEYKLHSDSYQTLYKMPEYIVLTNKIKKLESIRRTREDISIGTFDMLLYNTICMDEKSEIVYRLKKVFNYYNFENEHKEFKTN